MLSRQAQVSQSYSNKLERLKKEHSDVPIDSFFFARIMLGARHYVSYLPTLERSNRN